jgi:serine/threonine protein kinase
MSTSPERRGVLLRLAAEGVIPVVGGCAGVIVGGPEGGLVGVAVGQAVEKAINFFGARIVERWGAWLREQTPEARQSALAELAELSPEEARRCAGAALDELAPEASPEDRSVALEYLAAIPAALDRALLGAPGSVRSLPPTVSWREPRHLLQLLPTDVPPYAVPADLPGTPYRLVELIGSGGFGAVYRATTPSLQHLPLAIKFCLDPAMAAALHRERDNLERLMAAGGAGWSHRIVRLYGYDLDHATPFLVYEFAAGGDLSRHLARRGALPPAEALGLVTQMAQALAFAHRLGLVHRDLKPANVLLDGEMVKLADFGLGGVAAERVVNVSRFSGATGACFTLADQASLFRGAGTPLYMAPEQRRGEDPDPRHDLYSLGVVWYQLLVGDVTRELHPGWARELSVRHGVPAAHVALIERCVGWFDERPADAGELLRLLQEQPGAVAIEAPPAKPEPAPPAPQTETGSRLRQGLVSSLLKQVQWGHAEAARLNDRGPYVAWTVTVVTLGLLALGMIYADSRPRVETALVGLVWTVGLGLVVVPWAWREVRWRGVRTVVNDALATLEAEFPDLVRAWGGQSVLRDSEAFSSLRKLLPDGDLVSAPPADATRKARQARLLSLVRRLGRAQADFQRQRGPDVPWQSGAIAAFVTAACAATLATMSGGLMVAMLAALPVVGLFAWAAFSSFSRQEARRRVDEAKAALAAEFPDEVRSWGGPVVLRDPAAVREVRDAVERSSAESSLPVARPQGDGHQGLEGRLRKVLKLHEAVRRYFSDRPMPAPLVVLLAFLVLALPAGICAGAAYETYYRPQLVGDALYDYRGQRVEGSRLTTDAARLYSIYLHRNRTSAAWLAASTIAVVAAAGTWLLNYLSRYRGQVVGAFCASAFLFGMPAAFAAVVTNESREAVSTSHPTGDVASMQARRAGTLLLALAAGLALTGAGTALIHGQFRRRLSRARRALDAEVEALHREHPDLAPDAARDSEVVRRLVEQVTTPTQAQPGDSSPSR